MIRMCSRIAFAMLVLATLTGGLRADESDTRRKRVEKSLKLAIMPSDVAGYKIKDRMKALDAPGITVAVMDNFELDWAAAYGKADATTGRKLTTQTRHNVGSVSKTVCALTAMRLVEAGKLALDEPINNYLESWKLPENEFTEDNPVTLRLLLSHGAGTTVHGFPGYPPDAVLPSILQVLDGEDPANTAPIRVNRAPGEGYRYSGGGTTVVQLAIMDVTGKSFEEAAHELVLEPLGMSHTTYTQPVAGVDIGEHAIGQAGDPSFQGTEVFVAQGAAGLWSTPSDLARLMIGIMKAYRGDEGTIISQETAREMLARVSGDAGMGFFIGDHSGAPSFSHGGSNTGFHAYVWGMPSTGQGVVTIVNSDAGDELQQEVMRAVSESYQWPDGAWDFDVVETNKLDKKTANKFVGRYQLGSNDVITIARDGARLTYRECYWGSRVTEMLPLSNGHFQLVSGNNSFGGHAEFVFDTASSGNATALRRVGTAYVMPRLGKDTIRPLEHIEAQDIDLATAGWDAQPDLDLGLMRYTSRRFGLATENQQQAGIAVRAYVAKRFPLDQEAQEMLADAYAVAGEDGRAQETRLQYKTRTGALEYVSSQFEKGQADKALAAFDRIAADIGSPDAYRWLLDLAQSLDSPDDASTVARHAYKHLPNSATAQATLAHALWSQGKAPDAISMMNRAIATSPVVEQTVVERMWVRDRWKNETVTMSESEMSPYVGDYGQRHIVASEDKLSYYRGSNPPRELVPLGEHQFMMRDLDFFRLEFVMDADGRASEIVGHYSGGRRDESPRDPEE